MSFSALATSVQEDTCSSCQLVLEGIRAMEEDKGLIKHAFTRIYQDTLSLSLKPAGSRKGEQHPEKTVPFSPNVLLITILCLGSS